MAIKDQKHHNFFYEDENIRFNFVGTKIKIRYFYREETLI